MEPNTPIQTPQPQVVVNQTQPKSKSPALVCTLCGILAAAGIGFGVYGMFFQPKPTTDCGQNCNSTSNGNGTTNNGENTITPLSVEETQALLKEKYNLDTINTPSYDAMVLYLDNYNQNAKLMRLFHLAIRNDSCQDNICNYTVDYDTLNSYYHKYYGNSEDVEKKDYTFENAGACSPKGFTYIASDNAFKMEHSDGCGGAMPIRQLVKVINTTGEEKGFSALVLSTKVTLEDDQEPSWVYESLKAYKFFFTKDDDGYKLTTITKL